MQTAICTVRVSAMKMHVLLLFLLATCALSSQHHEEQALRVGLRESSHGESKRAEAARAPGEDVGTEQSSQQVKANLRSSSGRTITAKIDPRVIEESLQFQRQQVNAAAQHAPGSGETDHAALGVKPPSSSKMSLPLMLAMTLIMSMLSGVGAAPYLFTGKLNPYWSGIANAVGCGVMLAASFDLLEEAKPFSPKLVMGGIALGIIAMKLSQEYLEQYEDVSFSDLQGADARKALLIIGVMAAHAFGEGSGVGVSFSGPRGWAQGLLVTIAIGLHNIPEGMAVATVMVARGTPPRKALYWTLLSSLPQGIVAVPSYMFVESFSGLLPVALGFAAGCMLYIVFAELIPDALEAAESSHVACAATLSAAWLQYISMSIAQLEQPDGTMASPIRADVTAVLPDLLLLAPALLLPCAAATAAGMTLRSVPLSVGATVGVSGWSAVAGLIGASYAGRVTITAVLLHAVAGAASAAFLWRAFSAFCSGSSAEHGGKEKVEAAAAGALTAGSYAHANGGWNKDAGHSAPMGQSLHDPTASQWSQVSNSTVGLERRLGHSMDPGFVSVDLKLGSMHVPDPRVSGHAYGQEGALACRCGKGSDCDSPPPGEAFEAHEGHAAAQQLHAWSASPSKGHGAGQGMMVFSSHRDYQQAALFTLGMLVLMAVGHAMALAGGVIANAGGVAHLLLPVLISGTPLGLALSGLGTAFAGPGWRVPLTIACLASLSSIIALAWSVLAEPVGILSATQIGYNASGDVDKLTAFASGALGLVTAGYLWPPALRAKPAKAKAGLALGVLVAAGASLLTGGLCIGTPYCIGS